MNWHPNPPNPHMGSLADVEAFESVPWEQRIDGVQNTYDIFERAAALFAQSPAITLHTSPEPDGPTITLSYEELLARITATANALTTLGVTDDDVITILAPNVLEFHEVLWAAERVGIACCVNWMLAPEHIAGIMRAANSRFLVTTSTQPIDAIIEALGHDLTVITFGADLDARRNAESPMALRTSRVVGLEDIAALFHTGGTTGLPKLAKHTHRQEVLDAFASMWVNDIRAGDPIVVGLPLFHVNSVIITGLASFVAGGHCVYLTEAGYRDKEVMAQFWRFVARHHATWFVGVPTVYAALLALDAREADVSSLRYGLCGAAPLPVAVLEEVETRFNMVLLEQYGLTEGTAMCTSNPRDGERRHGSIGIRIPYLLTKLSPRGELLLKGPTVFAGYVNADDNANAWVGDWLNTGDLAEIDERGYIWLKGRSKDIIIRGGHNIDPAIIEGAIAEHPAVDLVAAVGRPDAYAGELPVAFVTLRPGATVTERELLAHAQSRVPERAAIPVQVTILEHMPVTAVGKIFKPPLREAAAHKEES